MTEFPKKPDGWDIKPLNGGISDPEAERAAINAAYKAFGNAIHLAGGEVVDTEESLPDNVVPLFPRKIIRKNR